MAMKKQKSERQADMWVVAAELPQGPGHPFYRRLNQLLAEGGSTGSLRALPEVLPRGDGAPEHCSGGVLPHAADRLL